MPSEFTVDIDYDVLPNLEGLMRSADVPLRDISERVVQDIKKNIRRGVTFHGRYYRKLAKKTIKDKTRLGVSNPDRALHRTGLMYKSIRWYKLQKNVYAVGISPVGRPRRDILGMMHQQIGVNKHIRITREFFGISNKRKQWAVQRLNRWIKNVVEKAYLKKVRKKWRF